SGLPTHWLPSIDNEPTFHRDGPTPIKSDLTFYIINGVISGLGHQFIKRRRAFLVWPREPLRPEYVNVGDPPLVKRNTGVITGAAGGLPTPLIIRGGPIRSDGHAKSDILAILGTIGTTQNDRLSLINLGAFLGIEL